MPKKVSPDRVVIVDETKVRHEPSAEDNLRMLSNRFLVDRSYLKTALESELRNLKQRVEIALEAVKDWDRLDAHLIVSAAGITEQIARWNQIYDYLAYVGIDPTTKK